MPPGVGVALGEPELWDPLGYPGLGPLIPGPSLLPLGGVWGDLAPVDRCPEGLLVIISLCCCRRLSIPCPVVGTLQDPAQKGELGFQTGCVECHEGGVMAGLGWKPEPASKCWWCEGAKPGPDREGGTPTPPQTFELRSDRLLGYCPDRLDPVGVVVEVGTVEFPGEMADGGNWWCCGYP